MTPPIENKAEQLAKAAVLNHFKVIGELTGSTTVISELELRAHGRRADLVLIGTKSIACEVKTHSDSLSRLKGQIDTYSQAFETVYVALATKHLGKGRLQVPRECGILELIGEHQIIVKLIRSPRHRRPTDATAQLALLPVGPLRRLVRESGAKVAPSGLRQTLLEHAASLPPHIISEFVVRYLHQKYRSTSELFWNKIFDRHIAPSDLALLRAWPTRAENSATPPDEFFTWYRDRHGTDAFGEIPEDLRNLLPF